MAGNGPLDNLSHTSSYENGHFIFCVMLKAQKHRWAVTDHEKTSSITKCSGMFSSFISYIICQVDMQDRRNKKEARLKTKYKEK